MTLKNKQIIPAVILTGLISLGGTPDYKVDSNKVELSDVYQNKLKELEASNPEDSLIKFKSGLIESTFLRLRKTRRFKITSPTNLNLTRLRWATLQFRPHRNL